MMVDNIGFPDYLVDNRLLDDEYKDVSIITNRPARKKELLNIGCVTRVLFPFVVVFLPEYIFVHQ